MFNFSQQQSSGSQELQQLYEKYAQRLELPAKTILLEEGDIAKKIYFIEKGCIRAWFHNKGKDITCQFFFENQGVASIESFLRKTPSLYTLEVIEPSVLYWIHKKDWDIIFKVINSIPEAREQFTEINLDRQLKYMKHFMSFIKYTPKERYLNLLKENPHIIQRIPQHYIASYLGITSVSLSRIRNAVSKSGKPVIY